MPRRSPTRFSELVETRMPSAAGVVHEAGLPGRDRYSPSGVFCSAVTTHIRHAPNDFIPG